MLTYDEVELSKRLDRAGAMRRAAARYKDACSRVSYLLSVPSDAEIVKNGEWEIAYRRALRDRRAADAELDMLAMQD